MNPVDLNTAVLYYPSIEFQSETWLKCALTVWDKVYRIVPPGYRPKDSDEVLEAIEAGLIRNINLSTVDLSRTATRFEHFWETVPFIPAGAEGPEEYADVRLHREKIDARIRPILESLSSKVAPDGWLRLNSRIANSYMLFLSEEVSRRRSIPKLTDSSDMFAAIQYFTNEGNFGESLSDESMSECSMSLVLETILPKGLESVRMSEVLRMSKDLKDERSAFRNSVSIFVQKLARVEDEERAKDLVKEYGDELTTRTMNTKKKIVELGSEVLRSLLVVGIPATLTALGVMVAKDSAITSSTGLWAGCVGAVATMADATRSPRRKWKSQEAAYYLQLNRNASGKKGVKLSYPRFDYLLNEYVND